MELIDLWHIGDEADWQRALDGYFENPSVRRNLVLEERINNINPSAIQQMDVQEFYNFLYDEYFVWKYTAKNRLATTRSKLEKHKDDNLQGLKKIQAGIFNLFAVDPEDTEILLCKTQQIHGLGTAGASGLLSILFPQYYGTLDQFLVYSLSRIRDIPEQFELERMKPESLSIKDGVILENILRAKSAELNDRFRTTVWTPRKVDMILWASDREMN